MTLGFVQTVHAAPRAINPSLEASSLPAPSLPVPNTVAPSFTYSPSSFSYPPKLAQNPSIPGGSLLPTSFPVASILPSFSNPPKLAQNPSLPAPSLAPSSFVVSNLSPSMTPAKLDPSLPAGSLAPTSFPASNIIPSLSHPAQLHPSLPAESLAPSSFPVSGIVHSFGLNFQGPSVIPSFQTVVPSMNTVGPSSFGTYVEIVAVATPTIPATEGPGMICSATPAWACVPV